MKKKHLFFALVAVVSLHVLAGCENIGNAPMGETPEQTKERLSKMTLEQRAGEIKKLGQPNWMKLDAIKQMYQKEGKTPPDSVIADLQGGGGPGGSTAGAPSGSPSGAPAVAAGGKTP